MDIVRARRLVAGAALVLLIGTTAARAQQPAAASAPPPDLSGIWNRLDTVGGASYDGISDLFPRAQLLSAAAARVPPPPPEPEDWNGKKVTTGTGAYLIPRVALAGGPDPNAGRCNIGAGGGVGGGIDINSAGAVLMVSRDEVVIARDGQPGGRRIYMNRTFPPAAYLPPSNVGHSAGRWDAGALVVTTTGFTPGLVSFGRGWRERETVLTEVFRLSPDGKRLTVTYTWHDPQIYVRPHTYEIAFERVENGYVFENWCDASIDHPENYTSIVPPQQNTDADKK